MKKHLIEYGGEFTINGYDECFRTYCGITENCSEKLIENNSFTKSIFETTCKNCMIAYANKLEVEISTVYNENMLNVLGQQPIHKHREYKRFKKNNLNIIS